MLFGNLFWTGSGKKFSSNSLTMLRMLLPLVIFFQLEKKCLIRPEGDISSGILMNRSFTRGQTCAKFFVCLLSGTAWKVSKYGSEYRKIRTRNNSAFGHFSHSVDFWFPIGLEAGFLSYKSWTPYLACNPLWSGYRILFDGHLIVSQSSCWTRRLA